MWPTTLFLNHILAGKKTQHEDPFEGLDTQHENQILEYGLDLRIARLIPPTNKFREINCPPRDILPSLQTIVVEDRVQDQRSAGNSLSDLSPAFVTPSQPKRSHGIFHSRTGRKLATHIELRDIFKLFLSKYSIEIRVTLAMDSTSRG